MCGIAGFELGPGSDKAASTLLRRLANRGPDGSWYEQVPPYGLVQTRLAVVDLSDHVRYPLVNEAGDLHLLFNGEIYEHDAHRRVLSARGHQFATRCDAEVLLHGYEEWREGVFERLDGMFAAALYDARSGALVLARDALGIKPLVYTSRGPFAFSSDALSLVAAGLCTAQVDRTAIEQYRAMCYLTPPLTGLLDVRQVRPGELLRRSASGEVSVTRWRSRPFAAPPEPDGVSADDVEEAFDRSVRAQLVADVPVGVFLSSGIDSSLVLDSAVRSGVRPTAFTIGFPGRGDFDETTIAGRLAGDLGVEHVIQELSGGFVETLELVCAALDQPLADSSAIATVQLAHLARGQVTVALSGTGGDDLFAGYYRHRAHRLMPVVRRIPRPVRDALARLPQARGAERKSAAALLGSYLRRLASTSAIDGFEQYLGLLCVGQESCLDSRPTGANRAMHHVRAEADVSIASTLLRRIQAFELGSYLPGDLLVKEDRMTMIAGLETRVPILGAEIVRLAERATDNQKMSLRAGKLLLRAMARKRLPGYVARSRKRGFAVPIADLFAGAWRCETREWLGSVTSSLVDVSQLVGLVDAQSLPATDLWAQAVLIEWERRVDQAAREAAGTVSAAQPLNRNV